MMAAAEIRPDWTIGTLNLTSGSVEFTTNDSLLQTAAIQPGDEIITASGLVLIIASITGQNSGTLMEPCPAGAAGSGQPLRIRFQPDGSRYNGATADLVQLLGSGNVYDFAGLDGSSGGVPVFTGAGTMDVVPSDEVGIQDPNGTLDALAGLAGENGKLPIFTGAGTMELVDKTDVGIQDPNGSLGALAGLTGAADTMPYFTGVGTMGRTALTALARTFLSRTTGAAMYGDLGQIPNANLPERLQAGSPNIGNANNATENGFYSADNASTNVPNGSPAVVLSVRYSATGGYQRWVSLTGASVYERRQSGGTWSAWKRVDIEGARGSSSGMFTVPSSGGDIIVQFGTTTASTDSGGFGDFALPVSYPTAQITSILTTGNMNASSAVLGPRTGPSDLSTSAVFFRSLTTSALIRINYVSFGY